MARPRIKQEMFTLPVRMPATTADMFKAITSFIRPRRSMSSYVVDMIDDFNKKNWNILTEKKQMSIDQNNKQ